MERYRLVDTAAIPVSMPAFRWHLWSYAARRESGWVVMGVFDTMAWLPIASISRKDSQRQQEENNGDVPRFLLLVSQISWCDVCCLSSYIIICTITRSSNQCLSSCISVSKLLLPYTFPFMTLP